MNFSITRIGHKKPLNDCLYDWDETNRIFTTDEKNVAIDMSNIDNANIKAGDNCIIKIGSNCVLNVGWDCTIEAQGNCEIIL